MISAYKKFYTGLNKLRDLPLLFLRLILAYGFYKPAMGKIKDIQAVGQNFESMGIPAPMLSGYLVGITEFLAVWLFLLGLGTRLISIPVMITMLVAIFAVHWQAGFAASAGGFEIPLYYFLMAFTLFVIGPGRISIDHLIGKKSLY
ncbi:MAG: DoxX family protein [Bacteroidales bacterium]